MPIRARRSSTSMVSISLSVQRDRAGLGEALVQIIQSVQGLEERALAGVGRPDDREDLVPPDLKSQILQGRDTLIEEAQTCRRLYARTLDHHFFFLRKR